MATTVLVTETFVVWLREQTSQVQDQVDVVMKVLEAKGVLLGAPFSSQIKGSDKLRELRPAGGVSPARAFYAFDPNRAAVVLCGGLKTDPNMYQTAIATAESEFAKHKAALGVAETTAGEIGRKTRKRKKKQ